MQPSVFMPTLPSAVPEPLAQFWYWWTALTVGASQVEVLGALTSFCMTPIATGE